MNQVYTLKQLQSYNRTQLWQLCRERGVKCYPASADCIEAICKAQEPIELVAVAEVAIPEQTETCAACPLFQPFNDGTGRGLCCGVADTSLVVREHHQQTQDCENLIDERSAEARVEPPQDQFSSWSSSGDDNHHATPYEAAVTLPNPPSAIETADRIFRAQDIEVLERHTGNRYVVRNRTNNNHYVVRPNHENPRHRCECGDANFRGMKCKHQIAVELSPPLRQIKRARELAVGDKIRHFNEVLKVCELHPYRYQGQIGTSELYGVRFALRLISADFKPKIVGMENYQEYYDNALAEYKREKEMCSWLYPVGEAEFEVLAG